MMAEENYFALEPLLVARLQEQVPELLVVKELMDVEEVEHQSCPLPAAFTFYGGEIVPQNENASAGASQLVDQVWLVMVAVRSFHQTNQAGHARKEAGTLVAKVNKALMGWRPGYPFGRLKKITPPFPQFGDGVLVVPLSFTTRVPVNADN